MATKGPQTLVGFLTAGAFGYSVYTAGKAFSGSAKRVDDDVGEFVEERLNRLRDELRGKPKLCRPVVMCGPSGAGKSTLIWKLRKEFPDDFQFSVSHTTRKQRPGEEDGVHYHFAKREDVQSAIARGDFIEHAEVHGNLYGTSKQSIRDVGEGCRICILDIDIQGVKSVQKDAGDLEAKFVFLAPPSIDALEERLRARGSESEEDIATRLKSAVFEIDEAQRVPFDARVVNDDIDRAYGQLRDFFKDEIERCRLIRVLKREEDLARRKSGSPR